MVANIVDSVNAQVPIAPGGALSVRAHRLSDVGDGWRALLLGAPPALL